MVFNAQPKAPKVPKFIEQGRAKLEKKGFNLGGNAAAASGSAAAMATPGVPKPVSAEQTGMATTPTAAASGGGFSAVLGNLTKDKAKTTTTTPAATGGLEPAATTQIAPTTAAPATTAAATGGTDPSVTAADTVTPTTTTPTTATGSTSGFSAALSQIPEAKSTAQLVTDYTSQDSQLMRLSATQGLQAANRRGLLNSSMAVGAAQDSMVKNAVPIASQDAQLQADARQKALDRATSLTTKDMELRESARTAASNMLVNMEQIYANQFNSIMANDKLSKGTREEMIASARRLRSQQRDFVQQMYDIDLTY